MSRGRFSNPEPSHTANTDDDDDMLLEKRLIALKSQKGDQTDGDSALSSIPELPLAPTKSYSITAKTLEKAKNYLQDNADNVKKLKELLVSQVLPLNDKTNNQLIKDSFEKKGLYDYDLSKYHHTYDDENKVINNIVYTLKYINNIYLIVLNNESKETFKLLFEDDKYKLSQDSLGSLPVANGSSGALRAPAVPVAPKPQPKAEARAIAETEAEENRVEIKLKLQEFILIYNRIVSNKNYQLKEQEGENFEELQYDKKLNITLAPAFGKDKRWEKWDKETDKGKITNNMHNILVKINEDIISLNKMMKNNENIINLQLTNLKTSIHNAIDAINIEYDNEKKTIINEIKREYMKATADMQYLISVYNKSSTKKGELKTEDDNEDINILTFTSNDPPPKEINKLNLTIIKLKNRYKYFFEKNTDIVGFYLASKEFNKALKEVYNFFKITPIMRVDISTKGGNPPTKYKSTGITVYILYEKKKYKRTVYTKDNRKTKYCKINNKYILLSKLNVVE